MKKITRKTQDNQSLIVIAMLGVTVAVVFSLLLSMVQTSLTLKGKMQVDNAGLYVFVIRTIAVLFANLLFVRKTEERVLPCVGIISAGYLIALLSVGLVLYDHSFQNFFTALVSVLLGGVLSLLIKLKPKRKQKYRPKIAK